MGQFEAVREKLHRAYETSRASMRRASGRSSENGDAGHEVTVETRPERTGKPTAAPAVRTGPPPAAGELPWALRVGAAWSWRLLLFALVAWVAFWVIAKLQVVIVPLATPSYGHFAVPLERHRTVVSRCH